MKDLNKDLVTLVEDPEMLEEAPPLSVWSLIFLVC